MKRSINVVFISILTMLSSIATAQETKEDGSNKPMMASAISIEEQKLVIDSLLSEEFDEELENPSDSLYGNLWDNATLNPYQVSIDSIRDTFVIRHLDEYVHPIENVVTSEYGPRWGHFHAGIDIRLHTGDSIKCAFSGKVRIARANKAYRRKGYGYFVVVRHDNGLETLYGHISKVLVKPDQKVKAGDILGLGGSTGRSTGPHLHFETRFKGNPINPRQFVDFDNNVILCDEYHVTKEESFKELREYKRHPGRYYTIRKGDSLSRIAKRHHTTVNRICKLNRIKATAKLRPGKRIRVS